MTSLERPAPPIMISWTLGACALGHSTKMSIDFAKYYSHILRHRAHRLLAHKPAAWDLGRRLGATGLNWFGTTQQDPGGSSIPHHVYMVGETVRSIMGSTVRSCGEAPKPCPHAEHWLLTIERSLQTGPKTKQSLEAKNGLREILRLRKMDVFNTNFNMERSKNINVNQKRPKIAKNIFGHILVKFENLYKLANFIKHHYFLSVFFIIDGQKTI